jgi:hypothetical protein
MKHHLCDFVKAAFSVPGSKIWFRVAFRQLKQRFIVLDEVVFYDVLKADYKFWGSFVFLKHLKDFVHVAFLMPEIQEMFSHVFSTPWKIPSSTSPKSFLRRPEGKLWAPMGISLPNSSLKRLCESRFLRFRIWFHIAFQHHESSLYRLHQSRFLRRLEVRLWVLTVSRLLKTSFKRSRKCIFPCTGCRIIFHMAFQHLDTTLLILKQRRFLRCPEGRLSSQEHSPT